MLKWFAFLMTAYTGLAFAGTPSEDTRDEALGCSDAILNAFATRTTEPVDTIAAAAFEECRDLWLRAAETAAIANGSAATPGSLYVVSYLRGAEEAYIKRARPIALMKRMAPNH